MSKQADTQNTQPEIHLDPSQYGYLQGTRAPFEGNLVLSAIGVLHAFALKEQTVVYTPNESFEETVKTGKTQITEMGLQALRLVELLTNEHLSNADEGIAIHQSSIMKKTAPKFEVPTTEAKPTEDESVLTEEPNTSEEPNATQKDPATEGN